MADLRNSLSNLVWLLSDASAERLYADYWGMLLRRVRHERDIGAREPNEPNVSYVNSILSEIAGKKWSLDPRQKPSDMQESVRTFLWNTQQFERLAPGGELKNMWEKAESLVERSCQGELDCHGYRIMQKEGSCFTQRFPCPLLMEEIELSEVTPEALIYRLNQPSSDRRLTCMGNVLREFASPTVQRSTVAVYFTFYYPGQVFEKANMGWVAARTADRLLIADSWNFIHWATQDEMNRFYSPSFIIKALLPGEDTGRLVDAYWIISEPVLANKQGKRSIATKSGHIGESSSFYRDFNIIARDYLARLDVAHLLRQGVAHFIAGPRTDSPVSIQLWDIGQSYATKPLLLHEIVKRPAGEPEELWRSKVRDKFTFFTKRIFENRWGCRTYVRFPILPKPQMQRGADVFVALNTSNPSIILRAIVELTEPLAICASLIGEKTSFKAAHELEVGIRHYVTGALRHETRHRAEEIEKIVTATRPQDEKEHLYGAIEDARCLAKVLLQQLTSTAVLGGPEDDEVSFADIRVTVETFLRAQPSLWHNFEVGSCKYYGFRGDEQMDRRILLLCLLLIRNAAQHSFPISDYPGKPAKPPGVDVSIERGDEMARDKMCLRITSWYSKTSKSTIISKFAQATPNRLLTGFDTALAIARDLNPTNFRLCFEINDEPSQDAEVDEPRWRITVSYMGRFRVPYSQ